MKLKTEMRKWRVKLVNFDVSKNRKSSTFVRLIHLFSGKVCIRHLKFTNNGN